MKLTPKPPSTPQSNVGQRIEPIRPPFNPVLLVLIRMVECGEVPHRYPSSEMWNKKVKS